MAIWNTGNENIEKWFVSYLEKSGLKVQSLTRPLGGAKEDLRAKCGEVTVLLRKDHMEIVGEIPSAIRKELMIRTVSHLGNLYDTCSGVVTMTPEAFATFARMYRRYLSSVRVKEALTS